MSAMSPHPNLTPYPTYKPSGIEWLGEVPQRWSIEKGKWLFTKTDRPVGLRMRLSRVFETGRSHYARIAAPLGSLNH